VGLGVLLACTPPRRSPEDPVILALGNQNVRRSEFDRHVTAIEVQGGSQLEPAVRQALLEPFLEERVIILEARSRGLLADNATPEQEQAAVRQLLAVAAQSLPPIPDEELESYYQEHKEDFRVPETVTLRQILVPTFNEARDLRRRLLKNSRSFENLARTRSRAPEAEAAGLMGVFSRGELPPELEKVAFALSPGRTSGIVQTALGYHVLRVDERQEPYERLLEDCREEIGARLKRARSEQAVRGFIQGLMARATVNRGASTPRLGDGS
jgi:peptidyl-prolyl cis-trans isomerase C